MNTKKIIKKSIFLLLFLIMNVSLFGQFESKWMAVGTLHNWYSEIGSEIEHGLYASQQYGLRWPASQPYKDIQCAKAIWIGSTNFTDEKGDNYPHKVVHVGPRVTGANEFFPISLKTVVPFDPMPAVFVDGDQSYLQQTEADLLDPNMPFDAMLINVANTQLGITMERKIYQYSHKGHNNYIVSEYKFKNTGNTDADADIELPNNTLTDVYFFFQYRWAIDRSSRYSIGNSSGWGINTMLDTRGDRVKVDADNPEGMRIQYAWHGKYPSFSAPYTDKDNKAIDNLGAPIITPFTPYTTREDTTWRLASAQFCGVITLHADKSATDKSDDITQPSTTSWVGSDDVLTQSNSAYDKAKMTQEYTTWMAGGHKSPRHCDVVQPDGKFMEPTGDPALGTPGGFSAANGYGPYTMGPGDSITIIWAEAVDGIDFQTGYDTGLKLKRRQITNLEKNQVVFQSKDSLFRTFRTILSDYNAGWNIPKPPKPPQIFEINSGGDRISLSWELYPGESPDAFEIYRARDRYDSNYTLIYTAPGSARSYDDITPIRGINYFYSIQCVGNGLKSDRNWTQSYDPATLKRPAGLTMDDIRIVPNPFIASTPYSQRFGTEEPDRIDFYGIPGRCKIQIFTELGELIYTIDHTDGSGDASWRSVTESNQVVVSGIYIAVITNSDTGEKAIKKFVIIR